MRFTTSSLLLLAALCLGAAAACGNDTITPSVATTPTSITNTFTGTLTPNGAASHPFTATGSGTVTATLKTLGGTNPPRIGLSLGTWNGSSCQIIIANDSAAVGTVVTGTVSSAGQLCVRIYDVGQLVEALTYEVQVVYP